MRFLASLLVCFAVLSDDPGAWPRILGSVGFLPSAPNGANVFVLRTGAPASAEWAARVEKGAFLILEGESSQAVWFGFRPGKEHVRVGSIQDVHRPGLPIIWENALELPRYEVPEHASIFARERWTGAPMLAGFRRGAGAVLWLAVPPGERGYERFPYVLHALYDMGLEPPFRSSRLWAFFDSAYRSRIDPDHFAARWRAAGIAALHIASWHFWEPDSERDAYLRKLIEACHARGILIYAWLELPHVSERFWNDHPEWREKTALLQDAHLDWRKLMNLANRACFRAVSGDLQKLLRRFDWDGVNVAELYFESLEGTSNPSRFTPMNGDVRTLFREKHGFDPVEIVAGRKTGDPLRAFLEFRAELAASMQREWLEEVSKARQDLPYLDIVLTHVDDRLDRGMRDATGADASRVLPFVSERNFTLLIEDPATVWNLGPQRYTDMARRYEGLGAKTVRLAVDLNVVERYQDVYPTKQQAGAELLQLVHAASAAFPRVALYFENSIHASDWRLLPAAASKVTRAEWVGPKLVVESPQAVGVRWSGGALVDGSLWPMQNDSVVWLPAGAHSIQPSGESPHARLLDFNGELKSARAIDGRQIELAYESSSRALAVLDFVPMRVAIDGVAEQPRLAGARSLILPRGQHLVTIQPE